MIEIAPTIYIFVLPAGVGQVEEYMMFTANNGTTVIYCIIAPFFLPS